MLWGRLGSASGGRAGRSIATTIRGRFRHFRSLYSQSSLVGAASVYQSFNAPTSRAGMRHGAGGRFLVRVLGATEASLKEGRALRRCAGLSGDRLTNRRSNYSARNHDPFWKVTRCSGERWNAASSATFGRAGERWRGCPIRQRSLKGAALPGWEPL